jgi:hypothetical protein
VKGPCGRQLQLQQQELLPGLPPPLWCELTAWSCSIRRHILLVGLCDTSSGLAWASCMYRKYTSCITASGCKLCSTGLLVWQAYLAACCCCCRCSAILLCSFSLCTSSTIQVPLPSPSPSPCRGTTTR